MISCHACGFENPEGTINCGRCSTVLPYSKPPVTESRFPKDQITRLTDHPPSANAKAALILGILSIVLLFFTGVCSPLTGIAGAIIGGRELKEMKRDRYSQRGETYCEVGVWAGWVTSTMSLVLLALYGVASIWLYTWFKEAFTR